MSANQGSQVKVIASTEIILGSRSSPFSLSNVATKISLKRIVFPIQVGVWNKRNEITLSPTSPIAPYFWPKLLQFAPDCHVQNVRIRRWQVDSVILEATRKIEIGQQLYLWFDEDLLVNGLGIPPYLSPINIKGGKNYVCDKCGHEYEAPNRLKIHLSLNCGSYTTDMIWSRLASSSSSPKFVVPTTTAVAAQFSLSFSSHRIRAPYFIPPTPSQSSNEQQRHRQREHLANNRKSNQLIRATNPLELVINSYASATSTLPGLQVQEVNSNNSMSISPPPTVSTTTTTSSLLLIPRPNRENSSRVPTTQQQQLATHDKVIEEQQAHLETLVSNMGKGKNGHVCLYCGKLYSRKYGLKIHIRTHTGYKPLACKICHRPFGDPSNLNKHVRLHSDGNTPYRCDICGKILVRRRDLDRHMQSRHAAATNNETISLNSTILNFTTTNTRAHVSGNSIRRRPIGQTNTADNTRSPIVIISNRIR